MPFPSDAHPNQYSWCSEVFPDEAVGTLSMLFCQSLEGLGPPLSSCLTRAVETSTNPLDTFAELRQVRLSVKERGCPVSQGLFLIGQSRFIGTEQHRARE